MKNTPEYMLRFYAEQYYNMNNGKSGISTVFKSKQIEDAYNDNTNPAERDAKIICGILGLDFPGSSAVPITSQEAIPFTSNPFEINPFASGQMLPPPPPQNEVLLPPNPDEIPITPTQTNGLIRQDGYDGQDGGKKRKNNKSKKTKIKSINESHISAHIPENNLSHNI